MKEFVLSSQSFGVRKIDYAAELNAEQLAVVQAGDGPALVLAGAGSGKTRTITYRVAWLLDHGVPPDRILLLTFTNKAAREMALRVESLLGTSPRGLWAGTFHSIANRILRMYGNREGYAPNFSILDEEDANDLVKVCIKALKIDPKGKRFPSPGVLKGIVSYSRNASLSVNEVLEKKHPSFLPFAHDIARIAEMYEAQKREHNAMDFDDLLTVLLRVLRNHPEVKQKLAEQFAYVFVDEFQDTNIVQAEIVHELASAHGNILAVGDDAQSIYSFRAAEIRNMLDFPRRYPNAQMYRLVTNYRSTPQILAVANHVIKHNEHQFEKELIAAVPSGDVPLLVPANSVSQEAQYIVEQILQLMTDGIASSNIVVLFRAAFHSQQVEFELMKRGIAYEYRGGMKFFERSHIKDAIAHLRVLVNHKDVMAWMRCLLMQPGIGPATANTAAMVLASQADVGSALYCTPMKGTKAQTGWLSAQKIFIAMREAPSVADMIRALAASDEYTAYLEAEYPNFRDRLDDIEQLATFAEQYADVGSFLESVSLTADFGVGPEVASSQSPVASEQDPKLVLSTIHQAKGLEWDAVFVINLSEGSFPSNRALEEPNGLEEERRLFYVATTRARKRLFLTYPITAGYDHIELRQPSQFLNEIPQQCYETVKLRYGGYAPGYEPGMSSQEPVASSQRRAANWGDFDEPTIVLDNDGERVSKPVPNMSFLRDIEDL